MQYLHWNGINRSTPAHEIPEHLAFVSGNKGDGKHVDTKKNQYKQSLKQMLSDDVKSIMSNLKINVITQLLENKANTKQINMNWNTGEINTDHERTVD